MTYGCEGGKQVQFYAAPARIKVEASNDVIISTVLFVSSLP